MPAAPHGPSRDLYCIELIPVPGVPGAGGRVELAYLPNPFTVAALVDGRLRYRPVAHLSPLPPPRSLGSFTQYVAWISSPTMDSVVRLGAVTEGTTTLPPIDLEKFVILITAEGSGERAAPEGRIVLRGQSPSTRLQPPEIVQLALGAMVDADSLAPPSDHGAHAAHGTTAGITARGAPASWTSVPMLPGLQMLAAEMALRPRVSPWLPTWSDTLPLVRPSQIARLAHGDTLHLEAGLVRRPFKGRDLTMYAFNGQHPGPLLMVPQHAEIVVELRNSLDQPTTIHWHGVRLDNRFDGVPDLTQAPVPPGGRFTYRIRFPDAGIYWYHPHVREDVQQELGLYGNMLVRSPHPDYHGPSHREEVLILDDLLLTESGLVPFGAEAATHALMGRFGDIMLVNGEPGYQLDVRRGEVVRFFLTNVSNTRTLNLSFAGARMKVVASDVGPFASEAWVESVVIAPAERYVVHVRFDASGTTALVNRVRGLDHLFGRFFSHVDTLGVVRVGEQAVNPDLAASFETLRRDSTASADAARYAEWVSRTPDRSLVLSLRRRDLPFITNQLLQLDSIFFAPIEWIGTMPSMNWASDARQVTWLLRDPATGRENMDIDWRFRRGEIVKLRLVSERQTVHAMQHPIHIHGQRFLILAVNGVPTRHHAWKDTVLLPAGATVDLLVEMTNPGRWMLHCHIAEHLSADMMMAFTVE
ncbi:MAG TPA: multicopper oxidase family protein [Gemmatimonadaceae bacterium]|nr:multicopper oxidase family protein [Gemmatimonadaceae bacterium]